MGPSDLGGTLPAGFTAHPHWDPAASEWHAVNYWWGWGENVQHLVLGADGEVRHSRLVPTTGGPMVHDLALSERWAVVYDLPCDFDLEGAMAGERLPYHWRPDEPARFGLIDRTDLDGDVRWIDVDPCYVFHTLNAYDDGDALVHRRRALAEDVRGRRQRAHRERHPGAVALDDRHRRRHAPRTSSSATVDEEFPRIDERLTGRRHRYGYGALNLTGRESEARGGVVKHDLDRGTSEVLDLGAGAGPNEFVFVPREGAAGEDEGWLVGLTYVRRARLERPGDRRGRRPLLRPRRPGAPPPAGALRLPRQLDPDGGMTDRALDDLWTSGRPRRPNVHGSGAPR